MNRLFLWILFVASCYSQGACQGAPGRSFQSFMACTVKESNKKPAWCEGITVEIKVIQHKLLKVDLRDPASDSCQDIDKPPNPPSDCCGTQLASDDIEKSGEASINQFPWVVLIKGGVVLIRSFSIGSLITSRHVLTTAQISNNYHFMQVHLGEFDWSHTGPDCVMVKNNQICNDGAIIIDIADIIRFHKKMNLENIQEGHDIAVVKLAEKVSYSEFIRPICLPTSDVLVSPSDNLRFINAGWGSTQPPYKELEVIKHYTTLPYVDAESCQKRYRNLTGTFFANVTILESNICAGGEKDLDTCKGDVGGPLMLKENGHYTLVGIVSYGYKCFTGLPSVFTKVYPYLNWINKTIDEL